MPCDRMALHTYFCRNRSGRAPFPLDVEDDDPIVTKDVVVWGSPEMRLSVLEVRQYPRRRQATSAEDSESDFRTRFVCTRSL